MNAETDRSQHPESLRQLEIDHLRTLVDHLPDILYLKDRDCRFTECNKPLLALLNADSYEQVIGKTDFDFYEPELAEKFHRDDLAVLESGKPLTQIESSIDSRGQPIFLHTSKVPLRDPDTQKITGLVGIGKDITEITLARAEVDKKSAELHAQKEELSAALEKLKFAQTNLVQSEKMASLGVLTAGIAHEINNPINFVYAGVNSMVKDFDDVKKVVQSMRSLPDANDPAAAIAELQKLQESVEFDEAFDALEETLQDIRLGATRITEIVAGLSKFSRLGKEAWQASKLHDDIETVLVLLKNKYKGRIHIERRFDPQLPLIECYPSKLNQAFMNILSNAIDSIGDERQDGRIEIATRYDDSHLFVTVTDNGEGIAPEVRDKIFDPFFTTKGIGKGTGLGMAITYSIVKEHQGEITFESEPGKGAAFTLKLPRQHQARETK